MIPLALSQKILLLGMICLLLPDADAFAPSATSRESLSTRHVPLPYHLRFERSKKVVSRPYSPINRVNNSINSNTKLRMYNLPPSGGGGGNGGWGDIVNGVLGIVLVFAFFASPLGGLVLSLYSSFLVLLFVLPLVASVGFQVWQNFVTIKSTCPNCGAPVTVLKRDKDTDIANPTLCFNCGAVIQANYDNSGVENISGRTGIDDLSAAPMSTGSIFDMFTTERVTTTTTTTTRKEDGKKKRKRETTIIDVEVEGEDDLPFQ